MVNVVSVNGFMVTGSFLPYSTSKGALMQVTRCCAMDLAPLAIRVNAVCQSWPDRNRSLLQPLDLDGYSLEEGCKVFGDFSLMKRQAAPEEVARAVAFLASDDASFILASAS